jgi:hypothetical protein
VEEHGMTADAGEAYHAPVPWLDRIADERFRLKKMGTSRERCFTVYCMDADRVSGARRTFFTTGGCVPRL